MAKEITFVCEPAPPATKVKRARGLKRAAAPVADDRASLTLNVALADGEDALILLEEDGVFSWHVQGEDVTPPAAHHAMMRQRGTTGRRPPKGSTRQRVKRFALSLPPAPTPVPVAERWRLREGSVRLRHQGTVYHTNYFLQKGTAIELTDWLQLQ